MPDRRGRLGVTLAEHDLGSDTSARYEKTWDDWLGRRVKTETPGFSKSSQAAMVVENEYDPLGTTGRLTKTTRSGYAPTYYAYDELGQLIRSGLDVGGNAGLDNDSDDRIQETNQYVESYDGAYWLTTTTATYFPGSSTSAPTSLFRLRLTGFSGDVVSETRGWDIENTGATDPTTTTTVEIDRDAKEVVTTTTAAGLAAAGTALSVNGLAVSLTTTDGLTYTSEYDELERLKREKNPRHTASGGDIGYKVYTYKTGTAMVEKITDAASHDVAQTTYDALGRPVETLNAEGKAVYSAYNLRGQLIRRWGDATYPVEYEYNPLGERVKMRTWQGSPVDFTDETAFAPGNYTYPASTGQATSWAYDPASGLLWQKTDADNKNVEFDYNVRGQVASRQWARKLPGTETRVTTFYAYDDDTGELTEVTYNDDEEDIPTPAVGYEYDRLGRVTSVTQDGIGTRAFAYDSGSPWRLKDETLPAFFGSRVITALYETTTDDDTGSIGSLTQGTVKGRLRGFQLGVSGNTDRDLAQTWKFSNQPRFAAVSAALDEGSPVDFVYAYAANSALVSGYTRGTFAVSREYEANRDLLTRLKTQYGTGSGSVRAQLDYAHDDIGRRVTVLQSGTAYEAYTKGQEYDAIFQVYAYNDRSELQSARLYRGDTPTTSPSSGDELPGRRFEYRYDAIGNRTSSGTTGTVSASSGVGDDEYTVNDLNQYRYRENNRVALAGTVDAGSHLAILGLDATVPKLDRAWAGSFEPENSGGPAIGEATIYAADIGGGTGGADLLRAATRQWLVPQRSQELTYDLDGNLIGDGLWTYAYDAENRLVRMTCALTSGFGSGYGFKRLQLDFKYDHMGRRVEKRVTDLDDSEILARRFVYDGWNLIAELDGDGDEIQRSYVWGLDLTGSLTASGGVGALVQMTNYSAGTPTGSYYPAYDGNGNIVSLVSAADGSLAAIYDYDPSGRIIRHEVYDAGVRDNPFRFSTKYFDEESRLVYYGHRYYSAELGRFINRDPIAESGGLNLYGFVGNNAINAWDYLGMDAFMTTSVRPDGTLWWHEGDGMTMEDFHNQSMAAATSIAIGMHAELVMAEAMKNFIAYEKAQAEDRARAATENSAPTASGSGGDDNGTNSDRDWEAENAAKYAAAGMEMAWGTWRGDPVIVDDTAWWYDSNVSIGMGPGGAASSPSGGGGMVAVPGGSSPSAGATPSSSAPTIVAAAGGDASGATDLYYADADVDFDQPSTAVICIQCHGVSAGGFSGNVNDFQGLTTLSGVTPETAVFYQNLADGLQTYGPPTLAISGIAVPTAIVSGPVMTYLATGGGSTVLPAGATYVVSPLGSGVAGSVTVAQGAAATGFIARQVLWTPAIVAGTGAAITSQAMNPSGSRMSPTLQSITNTLRSMWNWVSGGNSATGANSNGSSGKGN